MQESKVYKSRVKDQGSRFAAAIGGFTLIELVVAVGMLIILSGIVISYGRNADQSLVIANEEASLVALFNRAKSLSQTYLKNEPAGHERCSYGVHVDGDNRKAIVFQDLVAVGSDGGCAASRNNTYDSGEELGGAINSFALANGFQFSTSTDLRDVVFIPPDPTVIINNDPVVASATVTVNEADNQSVVFKIQVNNFGQITIK